MKRWRLFQRQLRLTTTSLVDRELGLDLLGKLLGRVADQYERACVFDALLHGRVFQGLAHRR